MLFFFLLKILSQIPTEQIDTKEIVLKYNAEEKLHHCIALVDMGKFITVILTL